jgi:4-amino-4-deoxy-L-arabinose transferase-like glycosyltransferase
MERELGRTGAGHVGRLLDGAEAALARLLAVAARSGAHRALVVGLVALAVILPGLAPMPVTDRDEARFAQASKQMVETGDLVDIRFQDRPRWKKPAGIYWMQAGAASLLGGAEAPIWAYRLPSALGALAAALLLGWAARPMVGSEGAALAAIMLATSLLAIGEANIAKTDAMLTACAVAALGGLARLLPEGPRPGWGVRLVFWAAIGAAILIKGPIVPLVVALALGWLWVAWRRPPPLARLRPLPGLALAALIAAPWLVAIWIVSDGAFFAESVGRDLLGKVQEGQEAHWGPPGLYLLLVWLTLWPWAALVPPAAPWLWQRRRADRLRLLAGWVIPFWLILEAVPTKLPHYVLPLYPALAVALAAWALAEDRPEPGRGLRRASAALVAVPGGLLAIALVGLPAALEGRVPWGALALALLGAGAVWLAARAALAGRVRAQVAAGLVASASLSAGVLQVGLPALDTAFPSPRIVALAEPWRPCASGPLISGGYREPSLVFLTETGTELPPPREIARRLAEDPGALVFLERRWMRFLERHWPDGPPDLVERGELSYFNYNRGDFETGVLLTRDDPRWAACAP